MSGTAGAGQELRGRTALVTGAAGSIGQAICRALAAEGARIAAVDIDAEGVRTLARTLGGECHPVATDISDPDQVARACREVADRLGPADILVNNAGVLSNNKLLDTSPAEWRRVLSVNLDAAFYFCQETVPHMKARRWGRIVNISSYAWKSGGLTAGTAYTVSKGGLVSLTFSVARETAKLGITVNGIAPAYVMTRMVTEQLTEDERRRQLETIPVGRFSQPEEVAHAVRFLVSPLSAFITGEILDMNGGFQFD